MEQAHGWIVDELRRKRPEAAAMADLIGRCATARPHPDWVTPAALPYSDLRPWSDWILRPFREEPPVMPVKGSWFGLQNPCPAGRNPVADVEPGLVPGKSKAVGVAAGFDSGDFVLVGETTRAGLKGLGEGGG